MKTPKSFLQPGPATSLKRYPFFPIIFFIANTFQLNRLLLFLSMALFMVLTSCDDPKTEIPVPVPEKGIVTAKAGPDVTIPLSQQTLNLDASASKDSQNKTLTFAWAVTLHPSTSHAAYLTNADQAVATFHPDVAGEFELEVTVSSENGQSKDKLLVTVTNQPGPGGPIVLEHVIHTDRTLTNVVADPNQPDYLVARNVDVIAKLTIEPGVVIEFEADTEMHLKGAISFKGTATQEIVFTGKTKQRGFWRGLLINSEFQTNEMDYVEVNFAGSNPIPYFSPNIKSNMSVTGGSVLKLTNSSFTNSAGYGLYMGGNFTGFAQNNFSENAGLPLFLRADQVHKLDAATHISLSGSENSKGVAIAGTIPFSYEVTWPALPNNIKYLALDDLVLEGGVEILPGTTIAFMADKGLYVKGNSGYLSAKGTATNKITFTGLNQTKGYWKGILFAASKTENQLDHVEVSFGGSSSLNNMPANLKTNVLVYGKNTNGMSGVLRVTNSSFTHGGGYGMYVDSDYGTLTHFANNHFGQNTGAAIFVTANQVHKLDAASRLNDQNGYNGVETEGTVRQQEEVSWPIFTDGANYFITNDLFFDSGVRIQNTRATHAGFLFATDKGLYVRGNGYFNAQGTSNNALFIFKGKNYNAHGSWKGISIATNNPQNRLHYVEIDNAGKSNLTGFGDLVSLGVRGSVNVTNSLIKNSGGFGIFVKRGGDINANAATVNTFENNTEANFYKEQ